MAEKPTPETDDDFEEFCELEPQVIDLSELGMTKDDLYPSPGQYGEYPWDRVRRLPPRPKKSGSAPRRQS